MGPLILVGIGMLCIVAGAVWYFLTADTPIKAESSMPVTKRSMGADDKSTFLRLLKNRLPNAGPVRIHFIDLQFQPLGESLQGIFEDAGWKTTLRQRLPSKTPLVKVQGVGIASYNKHYLEMIEASFRDIGITDLYTEVRDLGVPEDNPKFQEIKNTVYIYLGFPAEVAVPATKSGHNSEPDEHYYGSFGPGDVLYVDLSKGPVARAVVKFIPDSHHGVSIAPDKKRNGEQKILLTLHGSSAPTITMSDWDIVRGETLGDWQRLLLTCTCLEGTTELHVREF